MSAEETYYLFDTGPLLCFAAAKRGAALLKDRYEGRAICLTDVDADLKGLTRNPNPSVARAARNAIAAFSWIPRRVVDDRDVLQRAEDIRNLIDTFKRHKRVGDRRPREDWTEAVTLALAETLDARVIVINEDPGRDTADALGIHAICAVDILRALVAEGTLTANQAYQQYKQMVPNLDPGAVVTGPNDLK